MLETDSIEYTSKSARNINSIGNAVFIIDVVAGFIFLFLLFDDYQMRFLWGIGICIILCVTGLVTRLMCNCISIITENHYRKLNG